MMPQLDSTYYFSQFFWLCVSLSVLIVAFKKCFIPRMEKILQDRDRHIKGCSNAIVELEQKITNIENDIKHVREEELYNSAEIVHDTIKECESTLSARLDSLKAENETRVNTTQNEVRKEINNLWPGLKTQVEIAAQEVFEKLFLGRQENFKE